LRNIFACLVHERPECVADLVRNLRALDPDSGILLYNGSKDPGFLSGFPYERHGAMVHPAPRPQEWGKLHGFALDCARFLLEGPGFDALTVVDSDQIAARPGYSEHLARALAERPGVGLFGNAPGVQPRSTKMGPALAAYREIDLWRPFAQRFPGGEEKLFHWTFWPSTVLTAAAARDLLRLFDEDEMLAGILRRSRIWATEEVLLPTLTALLGYEVAASPFSYDLVQYRKAYSREDVEQALERPDVYWIHPVPRRYDDPIRQQVRQAYGHYEGNAGQPVAPPALGSSRAEPAARPLLLTVPILERMRKVEGWLSDEEADLLLAACSRALSDPGPGTVVEVGSYCGRSTVVLGSVVQALRPPGETGFRVHAIDPHLGQVGAVGQGIQNGRPTLERLQANLAAAGLTETVEVIRQCSYEVEWSRPIAFLLIDGLHDYFNVSRDFDHFEKWVVPGGYVAFHDYADYYPGVRAFVDELLAAGRYERVHLAHSLMVVCKRPAAAVQPAVTVSPARRVAPPPAVPLPLVTCIMPTADRRAFVPLALRQFLSQDWPADRAELIVLDDGEDRVADLMPDDPRIRYVPLDQKLSVGAKRNLACDMARGEVIVHWDDDDWMEERRIRFQVESLLAGQADLCGLPRLYFHDPGSGRSWEYTCMRRDKLWMAGATFCYRKSLWLGSPFPDVNNGEDSRFLWSDRPKKVLPLRDSSFYVARIHAANTGSRVGTGRGWRALPAGVVPGFLGQAARG
jgi:hypothetical protein